MREQFARLPADTVIEDTLPSTEPAEDLPAEPEATDDVVPDAPETPAEADTAPQSAGPREWSAGIVERSHPGIPPVTLREVRTAENDEFDRVVFEFDGDELPGYHVEYVDRPVRECGSGEVVEVAGEGWLRVRLEPARAHEFDGESAEVTVRDRDRDLDHPVLEQLTLICDFEAQVEWVLGVSSPNPYRVLELREPTRLVVDVQQ